MLLAALLDAGADLDVVRRAVAAVVGDTVRLRTSEVRRAGQRAFSLDVAAVGADQPERSWSEIRDLIDRADPGRLAPAAGRRALAVFGVLAAAEARVHGIAVDAVHFHEVGAWDSIADIVGVCAALEHLGVDRVVASDIAVGDGFVRTAHGILPVPVPAVVELLVGSTLGIAPLPTPAGKPRVSGAAEAPEDSRSATVGELATPTGVALLVALADAGGAAAPPMAALESVGIGAGHKELPGWANVVRVVLGDDPAAGDDLAAGDVPAAGGAPAGEDRRLHAQVGAAATGPLSGTPPDLPGPPVDLPGVPVDHGAVVETNVDDLDPRAWPDVLAAVLAAGAADAWLTPIVMKKGRPAHTLSALVVDPEAREAVVRAILTHTSTFGVRIGDVVRPALPRGFVAIDVACGAARAPVAVKVGHLDGRIVRATPEYADCAALAEAAGCPVAEALAVAAAAAAAAGLVPGSTAPPLADR